MTSINPLVTDTSHWDPIHDINAVKASGIVGCIIKATEAGGYTDPTYVQQQHLIKGAGLKFGCYHFCDASPVNAQIDNFMRFACPDPDELFCLDWEDNGGNCMSLANVKTWIAEVEKQLNRPNQCVLYGGNTIKEALGNTVDTFLGARRLWLCQYSSTPTWPKTWDSFFLWQYTDGQVGPQPHSINGIGNCDINSYDHGADQLIAEWATGSAAPGPTPLPPAEDVVTITISAPPGITVNVKQIGTTAPPRSKADTLASRRVEAGA